MKLSKILLTLIMCGLFSSCSLIFDSILYSRLNQDVLNSNYIFTDVYKTPIINVTMSCKLNMTYASESVDIWQSLETILESKVGDCEDFSKLFINIMYLEYGLKCNMVIVNSSRSVVEGGFVNHAIVELPDGTLVDPQLGNIVNYSIGYRFTFNELFKL